MIYNVSLTGKIVDHVGSYARELIDADELVRDILATLRHFAFEQDVDWDAADRMGERHYHAERDSGRMDD